MIDGLTITDAPPDAVIKPNPEASNGTAPSTIDDRPTLRERLGRGRREPKTPPEAKAKKSTPPNRPGKYVKPVTEFYETFALVVMPFKPRAGLYLITEQTETVTQEDGSQQEVSLGTGAHRCAEAWDYAAQKNESVRRLLEAATTLGVAGKLIAAHVPLILGMVENTKYDPAELLKHHFGQTEE